MICFYYTGGLLVTSRFVMQCFTDHICVFEAPFLCNTDTIPAAAVLLALPLLFSCPLLLISPVFFPSSEYVLRRSLAYGLIPHAMLF